uniref:Uncharacterized protein n=1 Tax=Arundo donax TaxID=35708 RepID=A0A0A9BJK7_ARUDO
MWLTVLVIIISDS